MCKEIKRLILLSQCTHLSKTDRDAITWIVQQVEPPVVEPDKGFNGYNFSLWPEIPNQIVFAELIKSRKAKKGSIMTQAWINNAAPHMNILKERGITVNQAIEVAAANGWQGFKAPWVLNELQGDQSTTSDNEITIQNVMGKVKNGGITSISQIPSHVRSELETQIRIGGISKDAALVALEKIGFIL